MLFDSVGPRHGPLDRQLIGCEPMPAAHLHHIVVTLYAPAAIATGGVEFAMTPETAGPGRCALREMA